MKTLTLINWGIVGLNTFFFVFLLVANASPTNDAAGRGMMGGILLLLLLLVALLVGLNLTSSRLAKIVALVLGILPLLLVAVPLITEAMRSPENTYSGPQEPTSQAAKTE